MQDHFNSLKYKVFHLFYLYYLAGNQDLTTKVQALENNLRVLEGEANNWKSLYSSLLAQYNGMVKNL